MKTNEIREKYLKFFAERGHAVTTTSSLLPENDPTTLFTGSGMQPMLPFLLGEKHPQGNRIADSQKCFRSGDINDVGDNRHTTFFEMLGNWSLGDYFKKEQIGWMFSFLVEELLLDPNRLYVSVFRGNPKIGIGKDQDSVVLWKEMFAQKGIEAKDYDCVEKDGMRDGRIFYYSESENWWSRSGTPDKMPVGEPGGPDSEIYWDFGEDLQLHEKSPWKNEVCHPACDCGRFLEIGNNVFMQYKKSENGFVELPQKNVDFGGGLERMAMAVRDIQDIFKIDIFDNARELLEKLSGIEYGQQDQKTKAFRVIMDHMRAAVFLVNDGAYPSNKDQGYFTRRLIRRSVRFADQLGIEDHFVEKIVESIIATYADVYSDLSANKKEIVNKIAKEEKKFKKTLANGLKEFNKLKDQSVISGEQAFILFSTYGFPLELTQELAAEKGIEVDVFGFEHEMEKHKSLSRIGAEQKFAGGLADHSEDVTKLHTATHLLHSALRKVLGDHVYQKGSNITAERLRFDFSHSEKMTEIQKQEVEDLVNSAIEQKYDVTVEEMPVEKAKKEGALGVFDGKYDRVVKVYSIGDFSKEICGGPHVSNLSELGTFKIKKEEASSAGVRRIKAILQ